MDQEQADCTALITCTAEGLDDEVLETLLISAQQVNLVICVNYAVRRKVLCNFGAFSNAYKSYCRSLKRMLEDNLQQQNGWKMQSRLAIWFPHVYVGVKRFDMWQIFIL